VNARKWISRLVVIAVLAGAAAFLWIKKPWVSKPAPLSFTTVPVDKGTIAAQVTATGTLSARSTVTVGAQVSGRIVELHADYNDVVKKGQLLAKLDPDLLNAQIEQAQAAYDSAVANMKRAQVTLTDGEKQYARQKSLQEQKLIAAATVDTAQATRDTAAAGVSQARAQVSQAAASLKQARTNLTYATILSPVDGTVLARSVELGQTVQSSMTAPTLFTIAEDLASMQINTAVAEADVGRIVEGLETSFTVDAFPDKTFKGVVRQVRNSPTTTSGVVTYDAVIDVDNADKMLRPGMTANVTFVLQKVADATKIPNSALRFKPSREQLQAVFKALGMEMPTRGGGRGGGGSGARGSGGGGPDGAPGGEMAGGGAGGGGRDKSRARVFKLVDGKPQMVMVKLGMTDGSSTEILEGDLKPGDLIITEIKGGSIPASTPASGGPGGRGRVSAF
jgi:HlyD family secretion protein